MKKVANVESEGFYMGLQERFLPVSHVLSWIMKNTIESIWKGLGLWSKQGIFYATELEPVHAVLDDRADLVSFYGRAIDQASILEQAHAAKEFHIKRTSGGNKRIIAKIIDRCNKLGSGYTTMKAGADEECERELEREVEEEEEEEKEVIRMKARSEKCWLYSSIFEVDSPTQLLPETEVFGLGKAIRQFMSCDSLGTIGWSSNVFCTKNFFTTIEIARQSQGFLDNFLRIPDCFVTFPDGSVLLLSDKEAESILQLFWNIKQKGYYFGHCIFESDISNNNLHLLRCCSGGGSLNISISDHDACTINLFNGECTYSGTHRQALKDMLSSAKKGENLNIAKISGEPVNLVTARMKNVNYERSDLEQICTELACEFEMRMDG